nr:uncharacterized protein LOC128694583 [Cherax quadricarinatus]
MVTVTVVGVAVTGVGGDGPESLFTKAGSTWQPDYSQNKLLALIIKDYHSHNHNTSPLNHISSLHNHTSSLHNPHSSLHEHSTSLHNHPTSNHNQGIFFSIVNRNGNIHKLLEEFVGTSVLDKVTQYFFNKLGVSESRSFGSTSVVRNSFSKDHVSQHSTYNQPHTAQDSAYHQLHTAEDSAYHQLHTAEDSAYHQLHTAEDSAYHQPYSTEDSAYHQPHTAEDSAYHQLHTAEDSAYHQPYSTEDSAYHQPHTAEDSAYHQPHTAEDSAYHQRDNNWHYGSGVATYVEDFDTRSSSYAEVDEYHEMPLKGACINMHSSYYTGLTCIDLYSALSIAALAVLLQFIYYFSVALLCPNAGNRKLVFNITNDNFVKVSSVQGSQTQLQNQSQNENQNQKQEEHQDQHQAQMESQTQSQAQSQTESQFQDQSQTVSVTARGFRSLRQTGSHSVRNEADEFHQDSF